MKDKHLCYIAKLQPVNATHIIIVWRKLRDEVSKPVPRMNDVNKTNNILWRQILYLGANIGTG
jgi:hypothetical protein